jgi:hypothetical protein
MSRRNGSQQTWEEFSGKVRNGPSSDNDITPLGSIVVIDPVRDLGLSDFLSSGILSQFSFPCTIQYNNKHGHSNASTAALSTTGFN